ncbi:MAG: hypothetical protein JXR41_12110 [Bacteroidales bacterium]|nr:hypothetical protein [Bacteroidales bacterium]MBN2763829.1 hypothetical protein [Bacteroidales bacterium]
MARANRYFVPGNLWIKDALEKQRYQRESKLTEAIAVGNKTFIENIRQQLNFKVRLGTMKMNPEVYELYEPEIPYNALF